MAVKMISLEGFRLKSPPDAVQCRSYCELLERGAILFFPSTPFDISQADLEFFQSQKQSGGQHHKNIAYRPRQDRVTGFADSSGKQTLLAAMRRYSEQTVHLVERLLIPYAGQWRLDYASFRPQQEKGRDLRLRARNDLLHVDSFPTRPTCGDRILRVFTNISPDEGRRWITTQTLDRVLQQFSSSADFAELLNESVWKRVSRRLDQVLEQIGLPALSRPRYDDFMLNLHHFLKENSIFQRDCEKQRWEFPPKSSWMVFTDFVPHAVLSGQYALEQTFLVSQDAMLVPALSPVRLLGELLSPSGR